MVPIVLKATVSIYDTQLKRHTIFVLFKCYVFVEFRSRTICPFAYHLIQMSGKHTRTGLIQR